MRLPRLRTALIPLVGALATLSVSVTPAHAKDIDPVGAGDLLPSPTDPVPKGQGTMYEEYGDNLGLWMLDTDYGWRDFEGTIHWIADLLMSLTVLVARACIVIVQWMFELLTIPELSKTVTDAISGASEGMMTTIMPAALAVGALAAFSSSKKARGSQLGQLAWVGLSAVFAVSLFTSPKVWVDGVDTTRQIGAEVALNAGAAGVGSGIEEFPFALDHEPAYTDNDRDNMMRKSADSIWRTYAATPWCLAEFGSLEVCKDHGLGVLKTNSTDTVKRRDLYLHDNVSGPAVGNASVDWRQGQTPVGRIVVTAIGLIAVLAFAVLVVALAFASFASLMAALMLLVSGSFFAALWCIPGRPRQWGATWFGFLVGFALQSAAAMLVLTTMLVIQASIATLMGTYGWAVSAGLMIVAAIAAWRFRKIIESIMGISGIVSPGAAVVGLLAARGAARMAAGLGGRTLRAITPRGAPVRLTPSAPPPPGPGGPLRGHIHRPPPPTGPTPALPATGPPPLPPPGPASVGAAGPGSPPPRPTRPPGNAAPPPPRPGQPPGPAGRGPGQPLGNGGTPSRESRPAPPKPTPAPPRPGPTLRAGRNDPGNYQFRQAPRPGAATPRVIRGQPRVVRGQVIARNDSTPGRKSTPADPPPDPRQ